MYETFLKTSGIDGWNHAVSGELEWRATPRDTLGLTGRFSQSRRVRQDFTNVIDDSAAVAPEPLVDENDRELIRRSRTDLFYERQFTPTVGGRVGFIFEDIDFNRDVNVDTRAYGGTLGGSYDLTSQTRFGVSGSGLYRENLGVGLQTSSTSIIGSVAASVRHEFVEGLTISLQAGPSIIETEEEDRRGFTTPEFTFRVRGGTLEARGIDPASAAPRDRCLLDGQARLDACPFVVVAGAIPPNTLVSLAPPPNGRGLSETNTSFFAEARIIKEWRRATGQVSYTRSESASAGVATSQIVDAVVAHMAIRPGGGWYFALRGEWSQRSVVADVRRTVILVAPGPALNGPFQYAAANSLTTVIVEDANNSDIEQWRANFTVTKNLSTNITVIGKLSYTASQREREFNANEVDTLFGYVGLRYEFDPLIF